MLGATSCAIMTRIWHMTQKLAPLDDLPNWAVISDARALQLLGFSRDTLARLDKSGEGPPKVMLSPRRHGRPIGGLREWLAQRSTNKQEQELTA
jgi:predicted DNA-binding transcriptional regulator AlpA